MTMNTHTKQYRDRIIGVMQRNNGVFINEPKVPIRIVGDVKKIRERNGIMRTDSISRRHVKSWVHSTHGHIIMIVY